MTTGAQSSLATRVVRCLGVSVVSTVVSVTTLAALSAGFGVAAWIANITATSIATIPSYHLNRRWTWGQRGASDPLREVVPFWVLAFAGLALSTVFVALVDPWATHHHLTPVVHTGVVIGGHLSGFAALWAVQFVVLDRVLFRPTSRAMA